MPHLTTYPLSMSLIINQRRCFGRETRNFLGCVDVERLKITVSYVTNRYDLYYLYMPPQPAASSQGHSRAGAGAREGRSRSMSPRPD